MRAAPLMVEKVRVLINQDQIHQKIKEVARQIERDYQGKNLVVVTVLKGAILLTADLIREIDLPLTLETIQCSSYGAGGARRSELKIFGLDRLDIKDKDVLIVDDIFDTGHTMAGLYKAFADLYPSSIKNCVLLKKMVPHETTIRPDYALFEIENLFVVGYGLDYKERYRGFPSVCVVDFLE